MLWRLCGTCACRRRYICSGNFRVNANGKHLDVWLIYRCENCETTWNMTILSRIKPDDIPTPVYQAFLANDSATALRYAFDVPLIQRNGCEICHEDLAYTVEKSSFPPWDDTLEIVSPYPLSIRLDALLSRELGFSRTKVQHLLESGDITSEASSLSAKTKIKGSLTLKGVPLDEKKDLPS